MNDEGVISVTDFLPRNPHHVAHKPLLDWLIRRVEVCIPCPLDIIPSRLKSLQVIRGRMPIRVECAPAFDYARDSHETSIVKDTSISVKPGVTAQCKALFESQNLTLDLRYIAESEIEGVGVPEIELKELDLSARGHKGKAVCVDMDLTEGQVVTFVLRTPPPPNGHEDKFHPTEERANALGVPLESMNPCCRSNLQRKKVG